MVIVDVLIFWFTQQTSIRPSSWILHVGADYDSGPGLEGAVDGPSPALFNRIISRYISRYISQSPEQAPISITRDLCSGLTTSRARYCKAFPEPGPIVCWSNITTRCAISLQLRRLNTVCTSTYERRQYYGWILWIILSKLGAIDLLEVHGLFAWRTGVSG